ncbi:MAG: threonine synthase [Betaproteobacteria bacterium]|nr:threonine synthase [Betaproteobacteria bacterium]
MRYVSTRGGAPAARFSDILLEGLAADGGLYVPEAIPRLDASEWERLRGLSYAELACEILARFIDDIPAADLRRIVAGAYTREIFGSEAIVPFKTLEPGLHLLGLSNGPTLAFKDMAMQLLGPLFEYLLARRARPEDRRLNILGATSGDTGSAAEYAMRGRQGIRVFMLSPQGRMSAFQRAQMYSLQDANIFNLAVKGVFDDCQDLVKAVNSDAAFKARYRIGAVNSINWGRIAAQLVYYVWGWLRATRSSGEEISFAVPSGNFGNIYAGHLAREMGLPLRQLILATNENDVLDEFFRTGRYRARKSIEVHATSSPSMDIAKASNFERYVFDLTGRDGSAVRELWRKLEHEGEFDLSGSAYFARVAATGFVSGRSSHADRLDTMRRIHERYGVTIDPHTADGIKVGLAHRQAGVPLVCLETALPIKFAETIREALGRDPERPAGFERIEQLPQRCSVIDAEAGALKRYIASHAG